MRRPWSCSPRASRVGWRRCDRRACLFPISRLEAARTSHADEARSGETSLIAPFRGTRRSFNRPRNVYRIKELPLMALPEFSMRSLLEAGAHFGHQTHRWNPKMERYIFGSRSNIHIIDLSQSIPLLHQALVKVREVAASGGRILFVGTKRQASEPIATAAKRCAQYYVNHRWLGGTLTNWRTVS